MLFWVKAFCLKWNTRHDDDDVDKRDDEDEKIRLNFTAIDTGDKNYADYGDDDDDDNNHDHDHDSNDDDDDDDDTG